MADFEKAGNILLVTGEDVYASNYRERVRDFLYSPSASSSPVRRGTHDFWITYAVPSLGGGEHAFEDVSVRPRPMRGIVRMGDVPPDTAVDIVRGHVHVILQEVAHHWLVPSDLKFRLGGREVGMPSGVEVTRRINDEASFGGDPILLARDDSHWSAYFQADSSPLDGLYWADQPSEDGFQVWKQAPLPSPPTITPSGLDPVTLIARYCDLDLVVMGILDPVDAYEATDGQFAWLEPRLMAPGSYHAGLVVAFERNDYLYFGFYRDHRKLGLQRTGESVTEVDLGTDYHPLASDGSGIALRVVRRGSKYYFQARYDNPLAGCAVAILRLLGRPVSRMLEDLARRRMFEDLESLSEVEPEGEFTRFRTVGTADVDDSPQAIGLIVKKWTHPHLAEAAFFAPQLLYGDTETTLRMRPLRSIPPGTAYDSLPSDQLRIDDPTGDAIIRLDSIGRLRLVTPFSTATDDGLAHHPHDHFNHWATVDGAPKALVRAPDGDFAFGSSCKVHRTIFTPWAAGWATERTMWGKLKTGPGSEVVVPEHVKAKWLAPPDDAYKMAFIVVARRRSDITSEIVARADVIRRYWDAAFDAATVGRRHSNSEL